MTLYIRETIGRLLYFLHRWGWWRAPGYWLDCWHRHYGYGQFRYTYGGEFSWAIGEFQFPVRELEGRRR